MNKLGIEQEKINQEMFELLTTAFGEPSLLIPMESVKIRGRSFCEIRAIRGRFYRKTRRQTKTAAIRATTSAVSPAMTACRAFLIPTDPKYTAKT